MSIEEIFRICERNGRRPLIVRRGRVSAVAVQGMEGRLFFGMDGEAVSLFRREAAERISTSKSGYFNPGGDGLWPAPEGTRFGYEYASGSWRVPASLVSAQYEVVAQAEDRLEISAEIDLVNDQQLGLPCRFTRKLRVDERPDGAAVIEQSDIIEYIGARELAAGSFLLAPWSLSQFAADDRSRAYFGDPGAAGVRDLYECSGKLLSAENGIFAMRRDPRRRIQLALPETSGFVALTLPGAGFRVTRTAHPLEAGLSPIDIADAPPDAGPGAPVRFSIYSDPSGFMELEIAGGMPENLTPGKKMSMDTTTVIEKMED